MSLSPMQTRFVEQYLIDLNATHAAIRAGYAEKNAKQQGYALLHQSDQSHHVGGGCAASWRKASASLQASPGRLRQHSAHGVGQGTK